MGMVEPSLNGSSFDQQPLSSSDPFPLTKAGALTLDEGYVIDVKPAYAAEGPELSIAGYRGMDRAGDGDRASVKRSGNICAQEAKRRVLHSLDFFVGLFCQRQFRTN